MKARIVFIDDEEPILKAISRMFRDFPYEIITFSDPEKALEQLQILNPDVIVSDYRMPKMDGITLLEAAAKLTPSAIRILLTGHADVSTAQHAINDARVFRFLTKPWQGTELHGAVESALFELERRQEEVWALSAERDSNQMLKNMNDSLRELLLEKEGVANIRGRALKVQVGSTARSLLAALEFRNAGLYATSTRVAHITAKLVELAGEHWLRDTAVLAGLLIDVGYLALAEIPASTASQLTSKHHCEMGGRILQSASFPPQVIESVRAHHENWDGSGPYGLAGVQIPFLARCLRIAHLITGALAPYKATDALPDEALIAVMDEAIARKIDPSLSLLIIGEIKARGARSLFPVRPPQLPELESLNLSVS